VTADRGKPTFLLVLAKDPKRRKSRSGSSSGSGAGRTAQHKSQNDSREKARSNRGARNGRRGDGQFVLYVEGARDREILGCWARRVNSSLTRCIEENTVILGGRRPARAVEDFRKRGGVAAGYSGLIVLDRDDHPQMDFAAVSRDVNSMDEVSMLGDSVSRSDASTEEAGLEMFVWSLRHIESYLLVPEAIRRMLGLEPDDRRVERSIAASTSLAGSNPSAWAKGMPLPPSNGSSNPSDRSSRRLATPGMRRSDASPGRSGRTSLHAKRILGSGGSLSEALGTELRAGEIARAMRPEELHGDVHLLFDRIGTLSGLSRKGPEVVIRS